MLIHAMFPLIMHCKTLNKIEYQYQYQSGNQCSYQSGNQLGNKYFRGLVKVQITHRPIPNINCYM